MEHVVQDKSQMLSLVTFNNILMCMCLYVIILKTMGKTENQVANVETNGYVEASSDGMCVCVL